MPKPLLFLSLVFICLWSNATIRRVGYSGLQLAGVDYTSFATAFTAAGNGDTIQIYGSVPLPTNGITINKRLVILGFGYNFDVNPNLQAIGIDAPSSFPGIMVFDVGSENSVIEGCDFAVGANALDVATTNITITRCRVPYYGIRLRNDLRAISNTKIIDCVASVGMFSPTGNPCTNIQIQNCILETATFYLNESSGTVTNCVTRPFISGQAPAIVFNSAAFLVKNCIFAVYNPVNVNCVYENNFFGTVQPANLPPGTNNRWGQTWANLFNRLGGASDNPAGYSDPSFAENYYIIKTGSAASSGGFDSNNNITECGIFGGDPAYKYRPGGVPPVPSIYFLAAPSTNANSNPYNVKVSVRSNN